MPGSTGPAQPSLWEARRHSSEAAEYLKILKNASPKVYQKLDWQGKHRFFYRGLKINWCRVSLRPRSWEQQSRLMFLERAAERDRCLLWDLEVRSQGHSGRGAGNTAP